MIDNDRMNAEVAVFSYNRVPENIYRFMDMGTSKPYLVIAARTNRHNVYTLRIELDKFPNEIPKVFVTRMLYMRSGSEMDGVSASMHTLSSEHGWTRICHYGSQAWSPKVTLFKIYAKCRLWLEAYEGHLATGRDIDHWLKHQS